MRIKYPFIPKSTAGLALGQFWSIPLCNGRFACGRVLQFDMRDGKRNARVFLAGLLNWSSETPPTVDSIASAIVLAQGAAHVKTIAENGGAILGVRPLELDGIQPELFLDRSPGRDCRLQRGFEMLGIAPADLQAQLRVFSTWGYGVIKILAEQRFG